MEPAELLSCQAGSLLEYQVLSCATGCAASRAEQWEAPKPPRQARQAGHRQAAALGPACSTVPPRSGQDLDQGSLFLAGQEHRDAMHGRGMHHAHGPGHLPSASAPVLPVTTVRQGDTGTILLSGAASVTAHPNSCVREGALPASHRPRSPALAKPGARGGHTASATRSQGGCDTDVRGWGPHVLTWQARHGSTQLPLIAKQVPSQSCAFPSHCSWGEFVPESHSAPHFQPKCIRGQFVPFVLVPALSLSLNSSLPSLVFTPLMYL